MVVEQSMHREFFFMVQTLRDIYCATLPPQILVVLLSFGQKSSWYFVSAEHEPGF